ncbi:methyltransferase domain-containing protein [Amycolatopsis sp. NPDC051373]|uniref:methyltransferase domain-containing protein n=1 Tax=Amycolatopsis sp. NPDC051373 TaxID=3155801 RepID=UPI00344D395A
MAEHRLYDPADPPAWLDPMWWADSESCNHLAHPGGVHTARLTAVADTVTSLVREHRIDWITDVGAGDGALLSLLPAGLRRSACGFELITESVRYANDVRGVEVREANVLTDDIPWGAPTNVVACTEMLEHLPDPHGFVGGVLAANADWVVASSPHGETPERHEWNHAWAWDHDGYAAMFTAAGFDVVEHRSVEWSQILVARSLS